MPSRMSGSGWDALPVDREGRQALLNVRELVEALPNIREWLGVPLECPGVVRRRCRTSRSGGRPSRMSGNGRETLPNIQEWWEAHPDIQELSGNPLECPGGSLKCLGVFKSPSRMSGRVFRPLSDMHESLTNTPGNPRGPPGHPGGPSEHSRKSERASRTSMRVSRPLPDIREGLRTTPGYPRGLPDIREGLPPLPDIREGLPNTDKHLGGPPNHSQTSEKAFNNSQIFVRAS